MVVPVSRDALDSGMKTDVNLNHEVYYHFLGTEQSQDVLCWRDPDHPKYIYIPQVTEDGKVSWPSSFFLYMEFWCKKKGSAPIYMSAGSMVHNPKSDDTCCYLLQYVILSVSETSEPVNKLYYCDLSALGGVKSAHGNGMLPFVKLVDRFEAYYGLIANDGTQFTFLTNKDAPRYKLARVDVDDDEPAGSPWTDVVPEDEDGKAVLESACAVHGHKLLVSYLSDVRCVLQMRSLVTGELLHDIPVDIGTVSGISGRRCDAEVFVEFASFLTPGIIYRCDVGSAVPEMDVYREISVPGFDRNEFEAKQVGN